MANWQAPKRAGNLLKGERKMIKIEYCQDGAPVSDWAVSDWVYNVKKNKDADHTFRVSTAPPIEAIRLEIALGNLAPEEVTFSYCDLLFQANKYGAITDWPVGFCDRGAAYAEDILRAATKRRCLERAGNLLKGG
jgi:hypothetical protein